MRAGSGLEGALGLRAKRDESAVGGGGAFGGRSAANAPYHGTEFALEEGDSRTGTVALSYDVQYRTAESDPETAL